MGVCECLRVFVSVCELVYVSHTSMTGCQKVINCLAIGADS